MRLYAEPRAARVCPCVRLATHCPLPRRFNETVRNLVEFLRKRDPRWKARDAWLAEEKSRKEVQQAKEIAAERRRKSAAREELKISAAAAQAERDAELQAMIDRGEIDGLSDSDSSEEEAMKYYCKACAKAFKTDKAWRNHKQSKKHIGRVKYLIREGLYDEDDAQEDEQYEDEEGLEPPEEGAEFSYAHYPVKVLKEALREAGIDFSDCVEKADLVARCAEIPLDKIDEDTEDSDSDKNCDSNNADEEGGTGSDSGSDEELVVRPGLKQAWVGPTETAGEGQDTDGDDEDEDAEETRGEQPPPGLSSKENKKWIKRQERLKRNQDSFEDREEDESRSNGKQQGVERQPAPEPAPTPLPLRKTEECFDCAGEGTLGRGKKAKKCKACNGTGVVRVPAVDEEEDRNDNHGGTSEPVRLTAKQKKALRKQKAQEAKLDEKDGVRGSGSQNFSVDGDDENRIKVAKDAHKQLHGVDSVEPEAALDSRAERAERLNCLNRHDLELLGEENNVGGMEETEQGAEQKCADETKGEGIGAGAASPVTLSKRDKRRAKNAAKKAAAEAAEADGGTAMVGGDSGDYECDVCQSRFQSRTKLYSAKPS